MSQINFYQLGAEKYAAEIYPQKLVCKHYWWADLRNQDFSGMDLSNAEFIGCILDGVSFANSNLENALFAHCVIADKERAPVFQVAQISEIHAHQNGFIFKDEIEVDSLIAEGTQRLLNMFSKGEHGTSKLYSDDFDYDKVEFLGILSQFSLAGFDRNSFDAIYRVREMLEVKFKESAKDVMLAEKVLLLHLGHLDTTRQQILELIRAGENDENGWFQVWQSALEWIAQFPWKIGDLGNSESFGILKEYLGRFPNLLPKFPWADWVANPEQIPLDAWKVLFPLVDLGFSNIFIRDENASIYSKSLQFATLFLIRSEDREMQKIGLEMLDQPAYFEAEMNADLPKLAEHFVSEENKDLAYWIYFKTKASRKEIVTMLMDGKIAEKYIAKIASNDDWWYCDEDQKPIMPVSEIQFLLKSKSLDQQIKGLHWASIFPYSELKEVLMQVAETAKGETQKLVKKALSRQE